MKKTTKVPKKRAPRTDVWAATPEELRVRKRHQFSLSDAAFTRLGVLAQKAESMSAVVEDLIMSARK